MEVSTEGEPQKPYERDNMNLGQGKVNRKFRLLRVAAGLTQKEVEMETGIGATKISYFERGFEKPTEQEAGQLGEAFGSTTGEILRCFQKEKLSRTKKN